MEILGKFVSLSNRNLDNMAMPKLKTDYFTYAQYLNWNDGKRWEIIDGMAYDMSPAPLVRHQEISMAFSLIIGNYLTGKQCKVFAAPFDVRFAEKDELNDETINVVQPDITVICDPSKLDERGAKGAPDWIIEIASPSTTKHDFVTKLLLYQKFGVREYWIVDSQTKTVHIFRKDLAGLYYEERIVAGDEQIAVGIFPDLIIELHKIFSEEN